MLCFSFVVFVWSLLHVFIRNKIARIKLGSEDIDIDIEKQPHKSEVGHISSFMSFWFKLAELCIYSFQLLLDPLIGLEGSLLSVEGIA